MLKRLLILGGGLAVTICLSFSLSLAELTGSKHDLSSLGGSPCAYCHSVHNAVGGLGRPAYMGSLPDVTKVYNSVTFDHDSATTISTVGNSDAPICLSCHDGATLVDDSVEIQTIKTNKIAFTSLDISSDLSNDHPVGFIFDASLDDEIKDPPEASHVHVTFGPGKNEMWCSSCHNVHNNSSPPFLVMSNNGSKICFECHIK